MFRALLSVELDRAEPGQDVACRGIQDRDQPRLKDAVAVRSGHERPRACHVDALEDRAIADSGRWNARHRSQKADDRIQQRGAWPSELRFEMGVDLEAATHYEGLDLAGLGQQR